MKSNHTFLKCEASHQIPAQRMPIMRAEAPHNRLHDGIMCQASCSKQDVLAQEAPSVLTFSTCVRKYTRKKVYVLKKPYTLEPDAVSQIPV